MINEVLHSFISVAKEGSFNKAAERLSISAPAVMKQMNALERSIGVELFHRTSQGITLTEAGQSFYRDARTILRYTRRAMERAQVVAGEVPRPGVCSRRKQKQVCVERREHIMNFEKFEIPQDEEGKKRYESAKRHAELALDAGKSEAEAEEIFKTVLEGTGTGTCGGRKSKCTSKHKTFEIPEDEEGRKRYENAKKHARLAEEQGKSSDEIHEIFKKVMEGKGVCGAKRKCTAKDKMFEIPEDEEGRKRYQVAMRHVEKAREDGKSSDEIHEIFKKVMEGKGVCGAKRKCTAKDKTFEIPEDEEGRKRYQSAMRHVEKAREEGKSTEEIHELFKKVMEGTGLCKGRKS